MKGEGRNIHFRIKTDLLDIIDNQSTNLGLTRSAFCKMVIMAHLKKIGVIKAIGSGDHDEH